MSPRSEEFMASAHERVQAAHAALAAGLPAPAVSAAYYAALYAARAALSEEDRYAKTHRGVWGLFGERFVLTDRFDARLYATARGMQELREAGDYDARRISGEQAESVVSDAERFIAAVVVLLKD